MKITVKAITGICLLALSSAAFAGVDVFDDRTAWQAQSGATSSEDFNSVVADTDFHPGALIFLGSGLTLQADGAAGNNFIDVAPISSEVNVDDSPVASLFNGQSANPLFPSIRFSSPVGAFGADFANLQDTLLRSEFELRLEGQVVTTVQPTIIDSPGVVRFYGFVMTAGEVFDEIRVLRIENDVFGMDNVEWGASNINTTPVPVLSPIGLALLVLGMMFIGFRSRLGRQRV